LPTGNQRDWAESLDRHGPALLLLARQWVPSRADAEDVVQDGFLRFWRSRDRAEDPAAYLFACVRTAALDFARGGRRRARRESAAATPEGSGGDAALFSCPLEQRERCEAIQAALRRLSEPQREVLVLKVWGRLSFPQIGRALGIPPDTAASRYRYALLKLREQLAEELIP
jgi:RNA polymerase sigma-70 factor (ECF subfamily)